MGDTADNPTESTVDTHKQGSSRPQIKLNYIKSNLYRVIHVDGVLGGAGPRGTVFLNVFSERLPIPRQQVFDLAPEGTLGAEHIDKRRIRAGIVREVEAAVVMDVATAKAVFEWLGSAIATAEREVIKEDSSITEKV